MRRGDVFPSKWLKAEDIEDDVTVTISNVVEEEMPDGESTKPIIYFREIEKGLCCNVTNWNTIETLTGEDDSDNWEGHQITLFSTEVDFKGKMTPAIRVRSKLKKSSKSTIGNNAKKPTAPDNGSLHGKGQYAPPEQQERYKTQLEDFLQKQEAAFVDIHTNKDTGEITPGLPKLVIKGGIWQLDNHLAKHCKESGLLPNAVIPEDGQKNRLIGALTAIVYFRSGDDRKKLAAEAKRYFAEKADEVTAKLAGEENDDAEPVTTEVDGGFDEFE
jgi:hypothetical protein